MVGRSGSTPGKLGGFSLLHGVQTGSGAQPASYPMGTGDPSPRNELAVGLGWPSSAEVKNEWNYISASIAWCRVKHRDNVPYTCLPPTPLFPDMYYPFRFHRLEYKCTDFTSYLYVLFCHGLLQFLPTKAIKWSLDNAGVFGPSKRLGYWISNIILQFLVNLLLTRILGKFNTANND
jgi:hypothetical protein